MSDMQEIQSQAEAKYKATVRETQEALQEATFAKKEEEQVARKQEHQRVQHKRREAYKKRTVQQAPCPIMVGNKVCNGELCAAMDGKFTHPTVCRNTSHTTRDNMGTCLLWHFWVPSKNSRQRTLSRSGRNGNGNNSQRLGSGGSPGSYGSKGKNVRTRPAGNSHLQQQQQRDSKIVANLKADMSMMHTELKEVRLGKKPTYSQVSEPALPQQQMRIQSVSLPAVDPSN
jgi:hypothetical protein